MNDIPELKAREFLKLRNRQHRYWKKLVKVSAEVAKTKNIDIRYLEPGDVIDRLDDAIYVRKEGKKAHADALLELSKDVVPSLYRRYYEGKQKYEDIMKELRRVA